MFELEGKLILLSMPTVTTLTKYETALVQLSGLIRLMYNFLSSVLHILFYNLLSMHTANDIYDIQIMIIINQH